MKAGYQVTEQPFECEFYQEVTPAGPPGSAQIESVFTDSFTAKGLATEPTACDGRSDYGRSDYGPFIAVGILAGGPFSGNEGTKTPEEAAVACDACYHQACDDITNLNTQVINELGGPAAHAIMTLARSSSGFFEDGSRMAPRATQSVPDTAFECKGGALVRWLNGFGPVAAVAAAGPQPIKLGACPSPSSPVRRSAPVWWYALGFRVGTRMRSVTCARRRRRPSWSRRSAGW
jgi:hypothetical protein